MQRSTVEDFLMDERVKTSMIGFTYLTDAILMYRPGMPMVKGVYTEVAKMHHSTATRVERGIRHALEAREGEKKTVNGEYISWAKIMCGRAEG